MYIQTLSRPQYPSYFASSRSPHSGTHSVSRFLAAMASPVGGESEPILDRNQDARRLADQANAEWGVLEKVMASFVTTATQGIVGDMRERGARLLVDLESLAQDLGRQLGYDLKSLVLERVADRLMAEGAQEDPRASGAETSFSRVTHGERESASICGFESSRLRTGIASRRNPQWSFGAGSRPQNSASPAATEPLTPEARSLVGKNYYFVLRLAAASRRKNGLPESVVDELEDVALKALTRAARNYDPADARGASFSTYLYSQINPDLAKACRKLGKRRGETLDDGEVEDLPDAGRGVGTNMEDEDLRKLLEREVRRLPPRQAEVVKLHIGLGDQPRMSLKQIAQQMGLDPASVRRLFGFGRRRLRQALEGQGVEEFMSRMLASAEFDAHDRPVMRLADHWFEVGESRRVRPCAA
jgi:RNA polymerase sigma factor (sigma-70 family)